MKTLYEYYQSKGEALPTVAQRAPLAQQAGIQNYAGTAEQNNALLAHLTRAQAPQQITPITETAPVISSKDNAQGYQQDSTKLDGINNGLGMYNEKGLVNGGQQEKDLSKPTGTEKTPTGIGFNSDTGRVETGSDPVSDKLTQWEIAQSEKVKVEAEAKKAEYAGLYNTSLAAIDATTQATINNINQSFDKRIKEQERLNNINIGRVKAYGLSEGGRFTPISFSDAITGREEEASNKISALESERTSLIAQAKSARDEGASKLLREKLADLDKVDNQIRNQLKTVQEESDRQYTLLKQARQEEEARHQEQVKKITAQLTALAPQYIEDFDNMSEAEQDKFIQQLTKSTGLDYATIYGVLQGASSAEFNKKYDRTKKDLELKESAITLKGKEADLAKKPFEIESEKALAAQRRASAAASYAAAAKSARTTPDPDAPKKTEAEITQEATSDMATEIEKTVGEDGFIHPKDYQTALRAWLKAGYDADTFHKKFANFRNPKDGGYNVPD